MTANFNADQYDELAEYGFGAIAVLALAALIYTEMVPAPEAWTLLAGVIVAISGAKAGEHRGKKKTDAPDKQELTDAFESVVNSLVGTSFEFGDAPAKDAGQQSQQGTPASHPAAEAKPDTESKTTTSPSGAPDPAESESVTAIAGIGSGRSADLSGAGVETVADLAAANAKRLAGETGLSVTRVKKWQALARER